MSTHQVFEGTWEEILGQAEGLAGQRVRVMVLSSDPDSSGAAGRPFHETATPAQWTEAFLSWARGCPRSGAPPLSDEDVSRESIYAERLDRQL